MFLLNDYTANLMSDVILSSEAMYITLVLLYASFILLLYNVIIIIYLVLNTYILVYKRIGFIKRYSNTNAGHVFTAQRASSVCRRRARYAES